MQTTCTGTMLVVGALTTKPTMSRAGELDTYTLLGAGIFKAFSLDASCFFCDVQALINCNFLPHRHPVLNIIF
jgi:hypothetical protein